MAKKGFAFKQRAKMLMQRVVLPCVYRVGCLRKVDRSLVVFADAHHDKRPVSMDRLVKTLTDKRSDIHIIERYRDYAGLGYVGQFLDAVKFMWLYAVSGCVVICDNYLPVAACKKRKKTTVIQLWHGPGAFKKFGYDAVSDIPANYRYNVFRNYNLVTVSGEKCVKPFSSAMRQKKGIVQAIGISRMDECLSKEYRDNCKKEFIKKYPEAKDKKIILWAPSFRGNAGDPYLVGLEAIDKLKKDLGDDWYVVCSIHPHLFKKYNREDLKGRMPTERMIPAADIFITDFSSVMCDACLHKKKMLLFAPDFDEYMGDRGTYMSIDEFPGEIVRSGDDLSDALMRCYDGYDTEKQNRFISDYLTACDGHATERIVSFIMEQTGE